MSPAFAAFIAPARPRCALWRTVLALVLVIAIGMALQLGAFAALRLAFGWPDEAAAAHLVTQDRPWAVLVLLSGFLPIAAAALIVTRVVLWRSPRTLWGEGWTVDFLRAILTMGLITAAVMLWPRDQDWPRARMPVLTWLAWLPLAILLIAGQTLAEELIFRGMMMQQLAARFPRQTAVWMLVPALVFGAAHYMPGMGAITPLSMGYAAIFGLLAADLVRRTGNLGAAWGMHLANNVTAIALFSSQDQLDGLALFKGTADPEAILAQPWLALPELLPVLAAWAILRRPARR